MSCLGLAFGIPGITWAATSMNHLQVTNLQGCPWSCFELFRHHLGRYFHEPSASRGVRGVVLSCVGAATAIVFSCLGLTFGIPGITWDATCMNGLQVTNLQDVLGVFLSCFWPTSMNHLQVTNLHVLGVVLSCLASFRHHQNDLGRHCRCFELFRAYFRHPRHHLSRYFHEPSAGHQPAGVSLELF